LRRQAPAMSWACAARHIGNRHNPAENAPSHPTTVGTGCFRHKCVVRPRPETRQSFVRPSFPSAARAALRKVQNALTRSAPRRPTVQFEGLRFRRWSHHPLRPGDWNGYLVCREPSVRNDGRAKNGLQIHDKSEIGRRQPPPPGNSPRQSTQLTVDCTPAAPRGDSGRFARRAVLQSD